MQCSRKICAWRIGELWSPKSVVPNMGTWQWFPFRDTPDNRVPEACVQSAPVVAVSRHHSSELVSLVAYRYETAQFNGDTWFLQLGDSFRIRSNPSGTRAVIFPPSARWEALRMAAVPIRRHSAVQHVFHSASCTAWTCPSNRCTSSTARYTSCGFM